MELNPAYPQTYVELALAYRRGGEPERAVRLLAEAMGTYPDSFAFPFNLGYVHHIEGELDDVPVVQAIIKEKGLLAVALEGSGFDVGNSAGYWAANLHSESKQLLLQNL